MKKKKIILFIVEGETEVLSLYSYFKKLHQEDIVEFQVAKGDITTVKNNPLKKVKEQVNKFCKRSHISKKDIRKIIEITDTDGSFISNKNIIEKNIGYTRYTKNNIYTKNKYNIEQRNLHKQQNIEFLTQLKMVYKIPYSIYYNSLNLDHIIANKTNLKNSEKIKYASKFALRYNEDTFLKYYLNNSFTVNLNYFDSWQYISKYNNSLHRHSNLNIYLKKFE